MSLSAFPIFHLTLELPILSKGKFFSANQVWYFVTKFEAEGREFANFMRSLEQFIQTVKGQNYFW